MRARNKVFVKELNLNLETLQGQIILETKKVLVMCERCFEEVCECLEIFVNI